MAGDIVSGLVPEAEGDNEAAGERPPAPGWLISGAMVLIALSATQISYVRDVKHGPYIAMCDVFAGFLFIAWLLVRGGHWRSLRLPPPVVWAWFAVMVLSAMQAGSMKQAVVKLAQTGLYFLATYTVYCDLLAAPKALRTAVKVLAGATTVIVLWWLVDYLHGSSVYATVLLDSHSRIMQKLASRTLAIQPLEMVSAFGSKHIYAGFLALVLPILLALSLAAKNAAEKAWLVGVVVVGLVTMTSGLIVWITFLVLLGVLIWPGVKAVRWPQTVAVLVAGVLVFGALPRNRDANLVEAFDPVERGELFKGGGGLPEGSQILKKRWIELLPATRMLSEHFILGCGTGNYQLNIGGHFSDLPNAKKSELDTANLYLVTAASEGFASLVCLLAFLGQFWQDRRAMAAQVSDAWGQALSAGMAGALVSLMVVNLFTSLLVRGTSLVWVLLFAITTLVGKDRILAVRPAAEPLAARPSSASEDL